MTDEFESPARRRLLKTIGASALIGGLAGCSGGGDGDDGGDGTDGGDGSDGSDGSDGDSGTTEGMGTETTGGDGSDGDGEDGEDGGDGEEEDLDPLGPTAWPMTGYDAGYASSHPGVTALGGDLTQRWAVEKSLEGKTGYQYLPFAVGNDHVVTATAQGTVYAFDAEDGSEEWTFEMGERGSYSGGIALFDGVVYTTDGDSDAGSPKYALDVETGEELWRNEEGGSFDPIVQNGLLYSQELNEVYARDVETGEVQWSVRRIAGIRNIAVADGHVYAQIERDSTDWQVLAIDAETGDEVWTSDGFDRQSSQRQTYLSAGYGSVYVTGNDGKVWAFEADSGSADWQNDVYTESEKGSVEPQQPAVIGPDHVYIGGYYVHALSRGDGNEEWTVGAEYDTRAAIAYADGEVYNAFDPGLVAYDASNGDELWSHDTTVDAGCVSAIAVTEGEAYLSMDDCGSQDPTIEVLERESASETETE